MPSGKVLTVDLGSNSLKLAEFIVDSNARLTLQNYAVEDLGIDPNKEQDRNPFLLQSLQKALQRIGFSSGKIHCCVSGHFVFTRFVKLPAVAPEQLSQMIVFEAQQNVPFPIDEVVWDYQILGREGAPDTEALIVAMKGDLVEDIAGLMSASNLKLGCVDVAPLTIINAFKYNYPDNPSCNLIIEIGAKSSNLIFVDGHQVFCRTVPIAGHLISQNISNEFQEPFIASELLKKGKGFVGLGGAYQDPDDAAAARISKIARGIFSRLHAEVSRSISFYRNQQGGKAPEAVYLSGGTSLMAYSDIFFNDKLNLPVEFFNPLRNVIVSPNIDSQKLNGEVGLLGSLVGLALRESGDVPVEINLDPPSFSAKKDQGKRMPFIWAAVAVWILFFLITAGTNMFMAMQVDKIILTLKSEYSQKDRFRKDIDDVKLKYDLAKLKVDSALKLKQQRDFWPELITSLQGAVSPGLWITEINLTYNKAEDEDSVRSARNVELPHVEEIPQNLPVAQTRTGRPRSGASRNRQDRRSASRQAPVELNLAPKGEVLIIRGLFERGEKPGIVNSFENNLKDTDYFRSEDAKSVEIVKREKPEKDKIALEYLIHARFNEEEQPDLTP
ncbi:MAG: pilus assembly protein PilM [Verrucomicrobiota bacterium]